MSVARIDNNNNTLPLLEKFISPLSELERVVVVDHANSSLAEQDIPMSDNPKDVCLLVKISDTVVGTVLLTTRHLSEKTQQWLRDNYNNNNTEDFLDFDFYRLRNQAFITKWILNPIYSKASKQILREIMRMYNKTLLFFHHNNSTTPPQDVIDTFTQLRPRRMMQTTNYNYSRISTDLRSDCPLFFLSKSLLSADKVIEPKRVVVVGGSSHSYAILELLLSVPYLSFPNVTLVLDHPPLPLLSNSSSYVEQETNLEDDFSVLFCYNN